MRITQARVQNYRSVIDSTPFTVESDKTILVGVNESGKTALLRAIQSVNPPDDVPAIDYLADYPRSLLNDLQTELIAPGDVPVAEVTFLLDPFDRVVFKPLLSRDDATITMTRYLDGALEYDLSGVEDVPTYGDIKQDLIRLRAHVAKQGDDDAVFAEWDDMLVGEMPISDDFLIAGNRATLLGTCLTAALPFIDEENSRERTRWELLEASAALAERREAALKVLIDRMPVLVYYSTYFTVRPRIDLESLAARQAANDIDDQYDFGNLCLLKFLGFTAKELSDLAAGAPVKPPQYETDASVREQHDTAVRAHQRNLDARGYRLNSAGVKLTKDIREVWGDDSMTLRLVPDGQYLKVMVEDDLGVEVELDQRSEGFRWLVSFFVVFRAQAQDELKNAVLLLDEPGLSLHALKQQEFRRTISLLGRNNQILYTTHSPFMVGSDELDLVRIVEMKSRTEGTKVHDRLQVDDPRSIFPLQAALGYELAQSMFSQKRNFVVEGVTDMFYVNAVNAAAAAAGGPTLKNDPAIVPAGTASKVAYFCAIYASQNLSVAALLDSDNEGDRAAEQDSLVAMLPSKAIMRVGDFIDPTYKGAATEDLFRMTLAGVARDLGWDSVDTISAQPMRPIANILDLEHQEISKWKLSKAFTTWLHAHGYDALGAAEKKAWGALCAAANKAL